MIPYFYILEHKETGIKYAGSRWAQGCDPGELLQKNGYHTSSNKVKAMGVDNFKIIEIKDITQCNMHPYEYETMFLQSHNCADSSEWLNTHNNTRPPPYGSEKYKKSLQEKYGVTHNSYIPGVREQMTKKMKETLAKNPNIAKDRMTSEVRASISAKTKNVPRSETAKANMKGRSGTWKRDDKDIEHLSRLMTKTNLEKNAMNNPESRAKVAASKLGRKKIKNPDGTYYWTKNGVRI